MKIWFARTLLIFLLIFMTGCVHVPQASTPTSIPPTSTSIVNERTATLAVTAGTTATVEATATTTMQVIPTTVRESAQEWLAFLENGQITLQDLTGQQLIPVKGQYQKLLGWSPNQAFLLAVQQDGANVVIDHSGNILVTLNNLPQPAFWAGPTEQHETASPSAEDWLAVSRSDSALELTSFPSGKSNILLEPSSLGADGQAFVRWGSSGEVILTPSLTQLQNKVSFANGPLAWLQQNGPDVQSIFTGGNGGSASQDFHKAYFQVLDSVPGSSIPILLGFYHLVLSQWR